MHIPMELAYTPIFVTCLFVVPALLVRSAMQKSMDLYSFCGWQLGLLASLSWLLVIANVGSVADYTPPSNPTFSLFVYVCLVVVYATPLMDSVVSESFRSRGTVWGSLCIAKLITLLGTVCIFYFMRGERAIARPHDFYRFRVITQNDPVLEGDGTDWVDGTLGVWHDPTKFAVSVFLRSTLILSACKVFVDFQCMLMVWFRSWWVFFWLF